METGCINIIEKGILINKLIASVILICFGTSFEILRFRRNANINHFLNPSSFTTESKYAISLVLNSIVLIDINSWWTINEAVGLREAHIPQREASYRFETIKEVTIVDPESRNMD